MGWLKWDVEQRQQVEALEALAKRSKSNTARKCLQIVGARRKCVICGHEDFDYQYQTEPFWRGHKTTYGNRNVTKYGGPIVEVACKKCGAVHCELPLSSKATA